MPRETVAVSHRCPRLCQKKKKNRWDSPLRSKFLSIATFYTKPVAELRKKRTSRSNRFPLRCVSKWYFLVILIHH